jgi:hypothetical protein
VHPLLANSPAFNTGKTGTGIPTIDERGMVRDGKPDVGAFEVSSQLSTTGINTSMSGPNLVRGTGGNDNLQGGSGSNILQGGYGNDTLKGGSSNDILQGGEGNDVLTGGPGSDNLNGGGGNDRFVYQSFLDKGDTIQYFDAGKDLIDLNKIIDGSKFLSSNPFRDYIKTAQVGSNTVVSVNPNGDASPNQFQEFLTLKNFTSSNLTANNVIV